MPGPNDTDDQLDDQLDDQTDDQADDSGDADDQPDDQNDAPADDKSNKRISDLQSAADKATARANKAEAALRALNAGKGGGAGTDPATEALMQELREASLDAVYGEFPELKKYGIERSLIEGSTRAEMREAATSVVALIKNLGTKVRNETLAEHGIKAEPTGAARKPSVNYESMSDEDFTKLLDSMG